jgi:membrane-bound ClpP family serine protease
VQFNNHLLAKENKTLLEYNETLLALGGIISIHMASFLDSSFMNQNNKPNLLLIMGMLGAVLLFVGFYSSHHELAYNYNVLLFNPYACATLFLL